MRPLPRALALAAGAAATLVVAAGARAADAPIYRCKSPEGRILYTDVPCAQGGPIEIHPGTPDPAARERLARAQAALDEGMQRLRADEAARREAQFAYAREAAFFAPPLDAPEPAVMGFWPVWGAYLPAAHPRPPHHGGSHKSKRGGSLPKDGKPKVPTAPAAARR